VPPESREKALSLYREGNRFFAAEQYSEALKKYEQAIQHWKHPGIHYNMAECLVNLGRSLEAHGQVKAAMRFGAAPLGKHLFRQAKTYLNMLERSLARVRLICREPGARVMLDGKPLFDGPGEAARLLTPGVHAVMASKPGFIAVAQQPNLPPGKITEIVLKLVPQKSEVVYERRWKRSWVPWSVLGAGAGIALTALPLYLVARKDFDDHKASFDNLCSAKPEGGCVPSSLDQNELKTWNSLEDLETAATRKYHASIGLLSVGAAVSAAGLVLVVMNLPRAVERPSKVPAVRPRVLRDRPRVVM
jgi:tetratricopeptide (TPR) repeat protein